MRHRMSGLFAGLVLGSVLAAGAAWAVTQPATLGEPARAGDYAIVAASECASIAAPLQQRSREASGTDSETPGRDTKRNRVHEAADNAEPTAVRDRDRDRDRDGGCTTEQDAVRAQTQEGVRTREQSGECETEPTREQAGNNQNGDGAHNAEPSEQGNDEGCGTPSAGEGSHEQNRSGSGNGGN